MDLSSNGLRAACAAHGIPNHMHGAVLRYVRSGWKPGDFLTAVLSNDLMEAVGRADDKNVGALRNYALLLYNDLPSPCWGSPENVKAWVEAGGAIGRGWAEEEEG